MKNYKIPLILLIIILGILSVLIFIGHRFQNYTQSTHKTVQELKTVLLVNSGTKTESFDISGFVGKTVLDATKANIGVVASGTGTNTFITSINGRVADSKKHEFWELDANGSETQVGAGSYIIQKGDSILWRINTY
jgi:cytoskeletal protein RodZ